MESSDPEPSRASKYNKMHEDYLRLVEEIVREKAAAAAAAGGNDGDKKATKMNAEEMKMVRRRIERLTRHLRRRRKQTVKKKKKNSESESESFTSDSSDEEMKIAKEQVKSLMEKAITIPENRAAAVAAVKIEDSKAEVDAGKIEDFKAEDETVFPRRRGRLMRYLRRLRSDSKDSDPRIEFHRAKAEESFMSYSDDSMG